MSTKGWMRWHAPVIWLWRNINRRIKVQANLGIKQEPVSKVIQKGLAEWLKW
jgi:hypothetical protein